VHNVLTYLGIAATGEGNQRADRLQQLPKLRLEKSHAVFTLTLHPTAAGIRLIPPSPSGSAVSTHVDVLHQPEHGKERHDA
jgi:hypothetical protein